MWGVPLGWHDEPAVFGQPVTVGIARHTGSIRVTGPVLSGAPAGSPAWSRDFHVLRLPLSVAVFADSGSDGVTIRLAGTGRGVATVLERPYCGGGPHAFDGEWTSGDPPDRVACFVVPAGFRPGYLLVGEPVGSGYQVPGRAIAVSMEGGRIGSN